MSVDECPSFGKQSVEDGQCSACMDKKKELFKACNVHTISLLRDDSDSEVHELPRRFHDNIGKMFIQKGFDHTGVKQILSWETVKPCRGERCVAYNLCEYTEGPRCKVESTYLRQVSAIIYRSYISVMDEPTMMRVGLHLMPIYQNLCRLKIYEAGLGDLITEDSKGKSSINPVYKEMREHIKLLEQTWRSIGLTQYFVDAVPDADVVFDKEGEQLEVPTGLKKKTRPMKRRMG